jgi:hypothetical protein
MYVLLETRRTGQVIQKKQDRAFGAGLYTVLFGVDGDA